MRAEVHESNACEDVCKLSDAIVERLEVVANTKKKTSRVSDLLFHCPLSLVRINMWLRTVQEFAMPHS